MIYRNVILFNYRKSLKFYTLKSIKCFIVIVVSFQVIFSIGRRGQEESKSIGR